MTADSKIVFPFALNNSNQMTVFCQNEQWGYDSVIDMSLGSCGSFPLGFKRTDFLDEVNKTIKDFSFLSGDFSTTNKYVLELSEKLYSLSDGYRSIFAVSGSDSVESALKVAKIYHNSQGHEQKKLMLGFDRSYHGSTFLSSSVSGSTYFHKINGRHPDCYSLSYDLNEIQHTIKELGPENISSLIIETCSWQQGLYSFDKAWWLSLQDICNRNNIVFIIDDIAFCGGKTGKFFGFDPNITPDIICTGKALSGGYFPLSNCMISEKIFSIIKEVRFMHGFTYTFNMSGILSSLHYLKVLEQEKIYDQYIIIKSKANILFDRLKQIDSVVDIRNYGLTWCVDINVKDINNKQIFDIFYNNGLYLGQWNSPAQTKQILIQLPNVYDELYFDNIEKRLTTAFGALC